MPRSRRAEGCYLRWHGPLSRVDVPPGKQSICYHASRLWAYVLVRSRSLTFWGLIHPHTTFFFFFFFFLVEINILLPSLCSQTQHRAPEPRSFLCGFSEPFTDCSDGEVIVVISNGYTAISCVFRRGADASQGVSAAPSTDDVICRQRFTNAPLRSTCEQASLCARGGGGGWECGSDWGERRAAVVFLWMERWKARAQSLWSQCMFAVYFVLLDLPGSWVWRRVVVGELDRESTGLGGHTEKKHQRMWCNPLSDVEETHQMHKLICCGLLGCDFYGIFAIFDFFKF